MTKCVNLSVSGPLAKARIRQVKTLADLYALCDDYDPHSGELFFDKHPMVFISILNFYRISKLHMPEDICPIGFQDEINFWGIGKHVLVKFWLRKIWNHIVFLSKKFKKACGLKRRQEAISY